MRLFCIQSGLQSGAYNMALDEALLEWVRKEAASTLIVRTYQWECPTLSLGVNQSERDIGLLLDFYSQTPSKPAQAVVRRPTGGRAILHGDDISFALITNEPELLRQSLKASYQILSGMVQTALQQMNIENRQNTDVPDTVYLRSPVCFETQCPSDLVDDKGQKLAGSAQLRRQGGLLQHGATFIKQYGATEAELFRQLTAISAERTQSTPQAFVMDWVRDLHQTLQADYLRLSKEIWDRASTTSGSHLVPASR